MVCKLEIYEYVPHANYRVWYATGKALKHMVESYRWYEL